MAIMATPRLRRWRVRVAHGSGKGQDPDGDDDEHDDLTEGVERPDVGEDHVDGVVAATRIAPRLESAPRAVGGPDRILAVASKSDRHGAAGQAGDDDPHGAPAPTDHWEAARQVTEPDHEPDDHHRLDQ